MSTSSSPDVRVARETEPSKKRDRPPALHIPRLSDVSSEEIRYGRVSMSSEEPSQEVDALLTDSHSFAYFCANS